MGVFTFQNENTSTVAPARLYKALVKDSDDLIPKAVEAIKSVEILQGNGGPGTIKKFTFVKDGKSTYLLYKIDAVDEANWRFKYSVIGGDEGFPETVEKISFEVKVVAGPSGGSVAKSTVKYHTKGDANPNEEELKSNL